MNLFLPRLRELLAESGKMQKDICDELGISKQKLFSYASPPFYGRIANRLRGFTLVA